MDTNYYSSNLRNVWCRFNLNLYNSLLKSISYKANNLGKRKVLKKATFLIYMCIIFSCTATRIRTATEEYTEKYTLQQQLLKQGYYDIKNVYNLKRIHL